MSPIVTVKNERDLPAIEFFRKHSAELSRFLIKEGVDKRALLTSATEFPMCKRGDG